MYADLAANPSTANTSATVLGSKYNQEALLAERSGDLAGAERLHLQALEIKEKGLGPNAVSTALTRNALGELYFTLGQLEEAEDCLQKALEVRTKAGPPLDAAVTRDNLARIYEAQGKLKEAKDIRLTGAPNTMCCGYYHVCSLLVIYLPRLVSCKCTGTVFPLDRLLQCGRCKV